jgi:osmotically-inducible protein OsmY
MAVSYIQGNTMANNEKLYNTVMDKLNFEPSLDASDITISIKGNSDVVVLGGTVKSYIEKTIAESAVKAIKGVRIVVDELAVDSSLWKKTSDTEIANAANNNLKWNILVPYDRIKVVVESGKVTLSGNVEWQYQKMSALHAINKIHGVRSITNNIIVEPLITIDPSEIKEQITKEFERHAKLDASNIQVTVDGKQIILKGNVRNFDEMDEAVKAAWSIPGVIEVKNELKIF